ncbi:hypothetical protein BCR34DRAFT_144503 [Clohesyomyces aquaticus]|uniref:Uncharacterized protein n=1 Tax=Clohesyomyces aquaticus TaxID=1231657 RepID=A0A1Y2A0G1_9PLEO|nr:hypothetical protein BCR34DRAFT_144503 [Clohesyomyces aquaticus]
MRASSAGPCAGRRGPQRQTFLATRRAFGRLALFVASLSIHPHPTMACQADPELQRNQQRCTASAASPPQARRQLEQRVLQEAAALRCADSRVESRQQPSFAAYEHATRDTFSFHSLFLITMPALTACVRRQRFCTLHSALRLCPFRVGSSVRNSTLGFLFSLPIGIRQRRHLEFDSFHISVCLIVK